MTNIPSIEALAKDWLFAGDEPGEEDVHVYEEFKEFLTQALTAEREAGAREERERILEELDQLVIWYNTNNQIPDSELKKEEEHWEMIKKTIKDSLREVQSNLIKVLTRPTK